MDQKYFKVFNPSSDILENPAKKYQQYFIPRGETITLGTSSNNNYIVTGSYNGREILNITSGSSASAVYRSIQTMLRYDKANIGVTDWIPVSNSTFHQPANYATFISFNRNLYGDRLCFYSVDNAQSFGFTIGGTTYTITDAYADLDYVYNIDTAYKSIDTNFGIVKNKSNGTIVGLAFGDLGLIMLYSNTPVVNPQNITDTKFLYQQTFHSKAFFCRITHDLFNATINRTWYTYSADLSSYITNPDIDFTAITAIGLYNNDDELLAIAKLSQPIAKYNDSELNAKVVIEY